MICNKALHYCDLCFVIYAASGRSLKGKKKKGRKVKHRKWSPFLSQGGQMAPDGVMNESAGCVYVCLCTRLCVCECALTSCGRFLSLKDSLSNETCWNGCRILAQPGCLCDFQTPSEELRHDWPQNGAGHNPSSSLLTQCEGAKAWGMATREIWRINALLNTARSIALRRLEPLRLFCQTKQTRAIHTLAVSIQHV